MRGVRVIPPSASALIDSLRGVGYSLETALADLVDNSISAGANVIDINCDWNGGEPHIVIIDDGAGMSESRLIEAMRFGGTGPLSERSETDLGRFGLGLKTASLSQCRSLTVASKTEAGVSKFTWDIDIIRESGDTWNLLEGGSIPDDTEQSLASTPSGTVVAWKKVDFGRIEDRPSHSAFIANLERVDRHLGMVFHRFISGDARKLSIRINSHKVQAWDPFIQRHEFTIQMPNKVLAGPGGIVKAKGFILPHRDRFKSEEEFERAGGPLGWTVQQGFYIYRQKRLLSAGGWLGLGGSRRWTREDSSRLARIQIDIPNTGDHDWQIDIRKALARPPEMIRPHLQQLAQNVRVRAREIFVHRGQHGVRARQTQVEKIWLVKPNGSSNRYGVKRDHYLVNLVRDRLNSLDRSYLDELLALIEKTVPVDRIWLDVTENGITSREDDKQEVIHSAWSLARLLETSGLSFEEAAAKVAATDPFDLEKDIVKQLRELREKII